MNNQCGPCLLYKHYLAQWKYDMKCINCGTIWRIPVQAPPTPPDSGSNTARPVENESLALLSSGPSQPTVPAQGSTRKRKSSPKIEKSVNQKGPRILEGSKPKPKHYGRRIVTCPNDWCTHSHVVSQKISMDRAIKNMKKHQVNCERNFQMGKRYQAHGNGPDKKTGRYVSLKDNGLGFGSIKVEKSDSD